MNFVTRFCLPVFLLAAVAAATSVFSAKPAVAADAPAGEFAKETIDLGIVVTDIDKSLKFYKEALGFEELLGFKVAGSFAAEVGLTNVELDIHMLALGKGENATKLKLMQLKGVDVKKSDNAFIHSQTGIRYVTIYINDTTAAVARLKKAGVTPIAKTPAEIPKDIAPGAWLTIVRDPDGNLIELAGPKK